MINKISELLRNSTKTTIITGNGINEMLQVSTDTADKSIYSEVNISKLDCKDFDECNKDFISYYKEACDKISFNRPSKAYDIIKKWQDKNIVDLVITQNIDGYHGTKKVIELYGNIHTFYCKNCRKEFDINYYNKSHNCDSYYTDFEDEYIKCSGMLRPSVVFQGEKPKHLELALFNMYKSDLILIIGSDMKDSITNKLPVMAKDIGAKLIAINKEPILSISEHIDYSIYGEEVIDTLEKLDSLIG